MAYEFGSWPMNNMPMCAKIWCYYKFCQRFSCSTRPGFPNFGTHRIQLHAHQLTRLPRKVSLQSVIRWFARVFLRRGHLESMAPVKFKKILWSAIRYRCWTADYLQRWGLINQGVCVFCRHEQETIDHILVGCAVIGQVQAQFLSQIGFPAVVPVGQTTLRDH